MPGAKKERVYAFPATQMNEGGIVGNVKATGLTTTRVNRLLLTLRQQTGYLPSNSCCVTAF